MSIDQEFPHTLVHTRRQLAGAAIKWANILEEELKRELHDAPSISITMDIWSSMNNKHQFIGVLAHFYSKEGEYTERTIGFAEISLERHTGETICKELLKIFSQLGITEKICSVTGDSASNNLAALRKLEQSLANYCEVVNRTYEHPKLGLISGQFDASNCAPCLNHVLNLVSKAFLDTVTGVASIDIDREREPSFNLDATIEEPEEGEQHEIDSEGFLINPLSNWEDDAETEESNTIRKCQKLAVALKSINSLGKFFLLCGLKRSGKDEAINMGNILPPLDVKTRWNSTFELLSFLQKRKLQIDLFFNCTKDMGRFFFIFLTLAKNPELF